LLPISKSIKVDVNVACPLPPGVTPLLLAAKAWPAEKIKNDAANAPATLLAFIAVLLFVLIRTDEIESTAKAHATLH